ncbi:MAG TPA: hypothetical protein ENH94_08885 [Phycisphaerales bacterium]|nr:hypothetical protein [Phycisphaerales bacterium]
MACLNHRNNIKYFSAILILAAVISGCQDPDKNADFDSLTMPVDLNTDIGSVALFHEFDAVNITGFGIVANLPGTGSAECDPDLRPVLAKYIRQQMGGKVKIDAHRFISSPNTAVVRVDGTIPSVAVEGQKFDITVTALSSTQTTSLDGGTLYTTKLMQRQGYVSFSQFGKTLATAAGPIYIDKLGDTKVNLKSAYIIGGGTVKMPVKLSLFLRNPNFMMSNAVRNRINERFGPKTARAVSAGEIQIKFPPEYNHQKARFLEMIRSLYLTNDRQTQTKRIKQLVDQLRTAKNKLKSEIALEAIGRTALDDLVGLLDDPDESVRFFVARCMLRIGDNRSPATLREIIADRNSRYRLAAVNAIGSGARRNDAIAILSTVLGDDDFAIRFAAYEQMVKLEDISVSQTPIAGGFTVDNVLHSGKKIIYASRSGSAKVVLFGAPIYCEKDIFVETEGGEIVINGVPGEKYVSLMRKHPQKPTLIGPLKSTFNVKDIIKTLCRRAGRSENKTLRPGLGVSYSEMLALLQQMCQSGAIKAEFIAEGVSGTDNIGR